MASNQAMPLLHFYRHLIVKRLRCNSRVVIPPILTLPPEHMGMSPALTERRSKLYLSTRAWVIVQL